jgi:hypothetical protein
MIKNNGKFIIKFEKEDEEFVKNLNWKRLDNGYNKAKEFFEYEGEISPIRINLIYSPEEYLFFSGYQKHESWMRACATNNNTIIIFAPSIVEKYTIHKKDDILETLIHEITHYFYGYSCMRKNLTKLPLWDEGIANYIAEKKFDYEIDFEFSTLKNFTDHSSKNYIGGYKLIEAIIKKFGIEGNKRIIEFLKNSSLEMSENELFSLFKKIFEIDVNSLMELKGGIKR